jgi:hypothetical protein
MDSARFAQPAPPAILDKGLAVRFQWTRSHGARERRQRWKIVNARNAGRANSRAKKRFFALPLLPQQRKNSDRDIRTNPSRADAVSSGLPAREIRLRRAFRQIVALTAVSPLAAFAACQGDDAAFATDASTEAGDDGANESRAPDPCEPIEIDGAYIEGDAASGCATFRALPCGVPVDAGIAQCLPTLDTCVAVCGPNFLFYCQLAPVTCSVDAGIFEDASIIVECISCPGSGGRRPLGYAAPSIRKRTPAGDYFAAMAHLEAASVRAFRDLARWLASFNAPKHLVRAAERAARDERRHARTIGRLARRFGGEPPPVRVRRARRPTLVALLEDDAREGCVAETFGALSATWQARSKNADVATTMRGVAIDETRHAALAWEILAWGWPKLGDDGQMRVARALDGAIRGLETRAAIGSAIERELAQALARTLRHEAQTACDRLEHVRKRARVGARVSA